MLNLNGVPVEKLYDKTLLDEINLTYLFDEGFLSFEFTDDSESGYEWLLDGLEDSHSDAHLYVFDRVSHRVRWQNCTSFPDMAMVQVIMQQPGAKEAIAFVEQQNARL